MDPGNQLFTLSLGLVPPWAMGAVRFTVEEKRLDLHGNFPKGSRFTCSVCGQGCPVYGIQEKVWCYLDFFQRSTMHARVQRVQCPEHGVYLVPVLLGTGRLGIHAVHPWLGDGDGTGDAGDASTGGRSTGLGDQQRRWRMVDNYVSQACAKVDMADICDVGVDETSSRRGHSYNSISVHLIGRRLPFATPCKDAPQTFAHFAQYLEVHGGHVEFTTEVSIDLSPAFQKGAAAVLPNAQVTFDHFHLMKLVNEIVDAVRHGEVLSHPDFKKSRWFWLKNTGKHTAKQKEHIQDLLKNQVLKAAQAYQFRLALQENFTIQNRQKGAVLPNAWVENAKTSGYSLGQVRLHTLMNHWDGLLRWFESLINNDILEGLNNLLQTAKTKARGYRTHKNFINMASLILGKLDLRLLHLK